MAFPPTRFRSSGYYGAAQRGGTPGGALGEERESHPPLFGLAIVGPPVARVGAQAGLPPGPTPSRAHDHRPPPHASWGYGFTPSRGGDSHPLSPGQPPGFTPGTLSASPNLLAPSPLGYGVRSKGGTPQRRVWCRASQDVPPARGSPGREGRCGGLPHPRPAPAPHREEVHPQPSPGSPPGSRPAAQGNLNEPNPIATHRL